MQFSFRSRHGIHRRQDRREISRRRSHHARRHFLDFDRFRRVPLHRGSRTDRSQDGRRHRRQK